MWCALADFRYAGFSMGVDLGGTNTLRELSGAVALELLLRNSGGFSNWLQFNRTLEMYVGPPDSLNFAQLHGLLLAAGINSPADLPNQAALTNLQNQLMSGQLGYSRSPADITFTIWVRKSTAAVVYRNGSTVCDGQLRLGNAFLIKSSGTKMEF
jgi:hypothetical protein